MIPPAPPPAIFLMGPTASGKTGLAVALAQRFPVEIISVDSALVYRGMDIGTAKPDAATRAHTPHHLVDILSPEASYSAAQFRADALGLMTDITARGKVPLLVGGTMLYFKTLEGGISELPPADPALRRQLETDAANHGWPSLHQRLAEIDPATAARLEPGDTQRVQRALEVYLISGKPLSAYFVEDREKPEFPYRLLKLALLPSDRAALHWRIEQRFDLMLEHGLVNELKNLRQHYNLHPGLPAMKCVGYRQAWQFLEGELDKAALRETGIAATRQLAKRQLTWLRGMNGLTELDCLSGDLTEKTFAAVGDFLQIG
ncbi:MAG: tRNA (adenosine(37)-N6)-dimethylallyltransferase MiaA [Methylobacillus sp.]|jgi:tRNA dimethylallyltransferase|nr:tRNA (adenosine(37)-N6)-dimethylallyltransferase MiaA [Methylobacillus sp.]